MRIPPSARAARRLAALIPGLAAAFAAGCAAPTQALRPDSVRPDQIVARATGEASWYGARFQGRPTASGEPFDLDAYTAAHRTLPFGTYCRVTNRRNGRQVVVRINDRGPWRRGRIIDLSRAAAAALDMIRAGHVPVLVEVLARGVVPP
jgi:rare lipoprotein A